jgi:hypothetical protein
MTEETKNKPDRDGAKRRAQNHFAAAQQRDVLVREEIAKERAATDAKTARLRALRLAKEEEDRAAAAANPPPPAPVRKTRKTVARAAS